MTNEVKKAVGKALNLVIECADVDGVVRRVDVNALLARVDFNAIIDSIDIDHHLDNVDVDRLLERIDLDALVERVDLAAVVGRSDVGSIMMMSTAGIFTHVLDAVRIQVVVIDLILLRIRQFKRWKDTRGALPMAPGDEEDLDYDVCPERSAEMAVAVQGRYAGLFSRALAMITDSAFLTLSFAVVVLVIQLYFIVFVGDIREDLRSAVSRDSIWALLNKEYFWTFVVYCIYWFLYFFLAIMLTGQTLGMGLTGIKVVDAKSGLAISVSQAIIRTVLLPFSVTFVPVLIMVGVVRSDGRMIHDIVSGTGCVYRWNAKFANLREKAEKAEEEAEIKRRKLERARRVSVRDGIMSSIPTIETRAVSEDSAEAKKER